METSTQELLNAVLALPDNDRAKLAVAILESLGPNNPNEIDETDELEQELGRRAQELRVDPSSSLSWSEVKALR